MDNPLQFSAIRRISFCRHIAVILILCTAAWILSA